SNPDGTVSPALNTVSVVSRPLDESNQCKFLKSTTGTSDYKVTLTPCTALQRYDVGMWFVLTADVTNAVTNVSLNIDNLGQHNIKQADGITDPLVGQIQAGWFYTIVYDGAVWRLMAPLQPQTVALAACTSPATCAGMYRVTIDRAAASPLILYGVEDPEAATAPAIWTPVQ
ncbi:MAG: hypothetical protein ACREMY_03295, partial [bacterium]